MSIPNVCLNWCYKESNCHWCEQPIKVATPAVSVFFWNKGNPDKRGYNVRLFFHPDCWVGQGMDYLKMNPYVARGSKRGPNKLNSLTTEQRAKRLAIIRRKASLEQRKRRVKSEYPDNLLTLYRLEAQIMDCMLDLHGLGGIPKRWKQCLMDELNIGTT